MDPNGASDPASNGLNGAQTRYVPPSRRRDKPQLVCNSCRRRKLKCNRGRPCDNCTRRGIGTSCTYVQNQSAETTKRPEPYAGVQDRIVQLESLVTSLMNSKSGASRDTRTNNILPSASTGPTSTSPSTGTSVPSKPDPPADPTQLSDSFGHINLNSKETAYADSTHWKAVLDEISELKEYFEDVNESAAVHGKNAAAEDEDVFDSLLGYSEKATREEIIAMLPPRPICDRLLAVFFNQANMSPGLFIVHCPTFLKQYEAFWQNNVTAHILWLGQLYGMMCLALAYQQYSGADTSPESRALVPLYRTKIIQCLNLGQYTKGGAGAMEGLLIYMQVEYMKSHDTQTEVWMLLGIIIRLALRMGYHRDPSHEPEITPYEGEMRRRRWAVISQFDIVTAAQFGLPRMIRDMQTDTQDPRNLTDADISEDMKELPPPRNENDHTIIQFWCQKNKLVKVFGRISELVTSVHPFPYSEVMDLDQQLSETYRTIPVTFLPRPMSQTILDPPELILGRSFMEVLYQKSRCVLHRKYMFAGKMNPGFAYSRITALEAALYILSSQATLDAECQPGGRLHDSRWKLGSVIKHEFLLATTILCLYLNQEAMEPSGIAVGGLETAADEALRERVIRQLSSNYLIWLRLSDSSEEAKKAVAALRLVLGKAQKAGFQGHEAIAKAMRDGMLQAGRGRDEKEMPMLFTPPSSNGGGSTGSQSNGQSPESAMELTDLPAVSSTNLIDPAEGMELFDIDTWDLGNFDTNMDGLYDFNFQVAQMTKS